MGRLRNIPADVFSIVQIVLKALSGGYGKTNLSFANFCRRDVISTTEINNCA